MTIKYLLFQGLLNQGVSDFAKPADELYACKNVYQYEIGKLEKVPGYSKCDNSQVVDTKSVNALHYYYNSSSDTDYLIAGSDSGSDYILKYRTTGAWTTITGAIYTDKAGAEIDMENYLDKVFIVGYDNKTFLDNATLNGTTYSTSDSSFNSSTTAPQGKYIVRYRDLLYVLNSHLSSTDYPNRVYYSDDPTSGAITWDNTATKFLEFGYDDGDEITGGADALDRLIVFKHFSTWKWDESNKKKIADTGCDSNKSIVKINGILYWTNRQGIWRWGGGQVQMISTKAQKFFDAMSKTNLEKTLVAVQHEFEYRVHIGDVTVDGYTYNNTWICFDTRREKIYIRSTYDEVKSANIYVEAGKKRAYFGNDNGYVMKFATRVDEVYSDDGNEIDSFFITNLLDHGAPNIIKNTNHLTLFSKYANNVKISVDVDNDDTYTISLGQILQKNVEEKDINTSGYRYRYKFYEKSSARSWQFEGFIVETNIKEYDI